MAGLWAHSFCGSNAASYACPYPAGKKAGSSQHQPHFQSRVPRVCTGGSHRRPPPLPCARLTGARCPTRTSTHKLTYSSSWFGLGWKGRAWPETQGPPSLVLPRDRRGWDTWIWVVSHDVLWGHPGIGGMGALGPWG